MTKSKKVALVDEEAPYSDERYPVGHPLRGKHNVKTASVVKKEFAKGIKGV